MPSTTTNLLLRKPLATEAPDGAGQIGNLADDIEDRFGRTAATAAALAAGTRFGQRALVGSVEYRWNGSAWKPWSSDWVAYVPSNGNATSITNMGTGASTSTWLTRYADGEVEVRGNVVIGSGGSVYGDVSLALPVPANPLIGSADVHGIVKLTHGSSSPVLGSIGFVSSSTVYLRAAGVSGSYPAETALSSTVPFAWASGDNLQARFRYTPA